MPTVFLIQPPNMKTNLSLLSAALLAVTTSGLFAQATTDPVGYISIPFVQNTNGSDGTLQIIAPTLDQKVLLQEVPAADQSGNTVITFASAIPAEVVPNYSFVEIRTIGHANEGYWATITAKGPNTITVNRPVPTGSSGVSFAIKPHQTITSFVGAGNTLNLDPGTEVADADTLQIINPGGTLSSSFFVGDPSLGAPLAGAVLDPDGNILVQTTPVAGEIPDVVINPGQGVLLTRRENTAGESGVVVGHVKTTETNIYLVAGLQLMDFKRATGATWLSSGIVANAVSVGDSNTGPLRGTELADSDQFNFVPKLNVLDGGYFSPDASFMLESITNQDAEGRDSLAIPEGTGIMVIRHASAGAGGVGYYNVTRQSITP
jgi:hypothetical protein